MTDVQPETPARRVWTEYQGIKVKDSDPKVRCRHPHWAYDVKRMGFLSDATLLALEDGIFLVVCDDCGYNGLTGRDPYVKPEGSYKPIIKQADTVMAHKSGTHWKKAPRGPKYDDDQIRVIIKVWLKWRSTRIKNWTQSACDELARLGFKPYHADKWSPSQLSGLARKYMKLDRFKNIKAAPMYDTDREAIAALVREVAARAGNGSTHVADNVRITEKKPPHKHTPVDFAKIIGDKEAAQKDEQQEEDAPVASANSSTPKLNFAGNSGASGQSAQSVAVDKDPGEKPIVHEPKKPAPAPVLAPLAKNDFEFIAELPDGSPMFRYKDGTLMVGKKVKAVEI